MKGSKGGIQMPRAIWSGAISFGLVSVPVKLYPAIQQKDVSFHQLDESSGARIKYKRVSAKSGREVPYEKIVKGYETGKGSYVVVKPEELEAIDPKATHSIDIEDFVDLEEIDPIYFEHTYYLAPGPGGTKAYHLLLEALKDSGKVAIGKVVIRTKQYLAAIRPYDGILALETMYFPDEIREAEDLKPDRTRITDKELKMARQLIESMSSSFDPEKYKDEYRARVMELIKKKARKPEYTVEEEVAEEPAAVTDLMEALRRSVEDSAGASKSGAHRPTRRRRSPGTKRRAKSRKS
jgi:DNA end-binding protein Ku